jgi:hypothetical protein
MDVLERSRDDIDIDETMLWMLFLLLWFGSGRLE